MWLQTGLSQSYSMWLSQLPVLTIGGPLPTRAQARRTPSLLRQNCTSWCRAGAGRRGLVGGVADEAVAAPRHRADQPLLAAGVADRGAGGADPAGQRRQRDDAALPDGVEELVGADHPVLVADQVGEHLEDLRLDLDRAAGAPQLDALEVKDAVGEPQAQGADPPRGAKSCDLERNTSSSQGLRPG